MKPAEQIEKSIQRLHIEAGAERREQTLNDLVQAHKHKRETPASSRRSFRRIVMQRKPMRIAAVIAIGIVLLGTFTLGRSSAAFSQVGEAVNSTLARLKDIVVGIRASKPEQEIRESDLPPVAGINEETSEVEKEPALAPGAISAQMQLWVSASEADTARLLAEQQIDLARAGTDPNVCFAVLGPEAVESLSTLLQSASGVRLVSSPRITVEDGGQGMLGTQAFAVAWQPTLTDDGQIEVNFAVHNGENGFELPTLCVQIGEALLIRGTGIMVPSDENAGESAEGVASTLLILVRMEVREPIQGTPTGLDEQPADQP